MTTTFRLQNYSKQKVDNDIKNWYNIIEEVVGS